MATQSDVRYAIKLGGETTFDAVSFKHKEALSTLFHTTIELVSFDDNPSFADILDQPVTLTFFRGNEPIRHINGIATQLIQGKTGKRRTYYTLIMEPAMARCRLTTDCRHFQQKTVVDIITEVLKEDGLQEVSFTETFMHPEKREFCQQYREDNLSFIQRLAAEEGFYFYFEHTESSHAIKFSNDLQTTPLIGDLLYNAKPAGDQPEPCLWETQYQEKLAPTKMVMKDNLFTHPDYRLKQTEAMVVKGTPNEKRDYEMFDSPGRFKNDNPGKPFTKVRLEEHRRDAITLTGKGDDMRLLPGYQVNLTGHDRKALNAAWAVISVTHEGSQTGILDEEAGRSDAAGSHYKNDVMMIPWNGQWRATTNPKPVVDGPQIATVVGPPGEEIYTDPWGRVKLMFEYDRYNKFDENSSCWIRVSQGWAGTQFGGMAVPRIGQSVIVDFLEGDPDQPIVTGRTYNANNQPPYPLPANKTRMTIKSKTHKGKGFNELRFEDEKDKEEVFIHAQKDQNNVVLNNETTQVGVDRTENVGHDERVTIGNDVFYEVGRNQQEHYGKDHLQTVGNIHKQNIATDHLYETGGHFDGQVNGKYELRVGDSIKNYTKTHTLMASDRFEIKGPGGKITLDSSGITLEAPQINLKGQVNAGGSGSSQVPTLSLGAKEALPICEECERMKKEATT